MNEIYLLDKDSEPVGPYSREQLIESIRQRKIKQKDLGWTEGMDEWEKLETILFAHLKGWGRATYLGTWFIVFSYFFFLNLFLQHWSITPGVEGDTEIWIIANTVGWIAAGLCLAPRLSHIGMSRWWAIAGALPLIGYYFRIMGLLAPQGYAETKTMPVISRIVVLLIGFIFPATSIIMAIAII